MRQFQTPAAGEGRLTVEQAQERVLSEIEPLPVEPLPPVAAAPEPLVAELVLRWELNGDAVERVLEGVLKRSV